MIWWLLPLYVNCEILDIKKTIEQQKQSPGGVLYKRVLKNFEKIIGKPLRVSLFSGKVLG